MRVNILNKGFWATPFLAVAASVGLVGCSSDSIPVLDNQIIAINTEQALEEVRLEGALLALLEIEPDFQGTREYVRNFDQYSVECNLIDDLTHLLVRASAGAELTPLIPESTTFESRFFSIENFALDPEDPDSMLKITEHVRVDFKVGIATFEDVDAASRFVETIRTVSNDCGSLKSEFELMGSKKTYETSIVDVHEEAGVLALKTTNGLGSTYLDNAFLFSRFGNLLVISQSSFDVEGLQYFDLTEEDLVLAMASIEAQVESSIASAANKSS